MEAALKSCSASWKESFEIGSGVCVAFLGLGKAGPTAVMAILLEAVIGVARLMGECSSVLAPVGSDGSVATDLSEIVAPFFHLEPVSGVDLMRFMKTSS